MKSKDRDIPTKKSLLVFNPVWVLMYVCTTSTLIKRLQKKLAGNYKRMKREILNKSWKHHPIKHKLYGHFPPISQTVRAKQAGYFLWFDFTAYQPL